MMRNIAWTLLLKICQLCYKLVITPHNLSIFYFFFGRIITFPLKSTKWRQALWTIVWCICAYKFAQNQRNSKS